VTAKHPNELLSLAKSLLVQAEAGPGQLSPLIRQSLRLARETGSKLFEEWLYGELNGYMDYSVIARLRVLTKAERELLWDMQYRGRRIDDPKVGWRGGRPTMSFKGDEDRMFTVSIVEIEERLQVTDRLAAEQSGLAKVYRQVHSVLHENLLTLYVELKYRGVPTSIFEETRREVDSRLALLCPDAMEAFSSAYDKLRSARAEDWATALTSCRRLLKEVADVLAPSSEVVPQALGGEEEHELSSERYVNRLKDLVDKSVSSKSDRQLWKEQADGLKRMIDAVYRKASKGTHAHVTQREARRVVIATYLLVGDLIDLLPDSVLVKEAGSVSDPAQQGSP
jgi:hypothetical protein